MMPRLRTTLLKALMGSILIALLLAVAGRSASAHSMQPQQVVTGQHDVDMQAGKQDPAQPNRACADRVRCCTVGACPMVGEIDLGSFEVDDTIQFVRSTYQPAARSSAPGIRALPDLPPPRLRA